MTRQDKARQEKTRQDKKVWYDVMWCDVIWSYTCVCISLDHTMMIGSGDYTDLLRWNKQLVISSANWPLEFGIRGTYKCTRNHKYCGMKNSTGPLSDLRFRQTKEWRQAAEPAYMKNNWGVQSKNGLQHLWWNIVFFILCQGIRCHFPCITLLIFGHSVPPYR